jgi:P27 family predicted phage terminase small subunit
MLQILQGNPGRRKLNPQEPMPELVDMPRPPKHLRKLAKEKWNELTPELCRLRLLTKLDLTLLETYCEEYASYRKASAFIEERGEFFPIKNEKGEVYDLRQYPAVAQRTNAIAQMTRIGDRLGLSPAYRTRISLPDKEKPHNETDLRLLG